MQIGHDIVDYRKNWKNVNLGLDSYPTTIEEVYRLLTNKKN